MLCSVLCLRNTTNYTTEQGPWIVVYILQGCPNRNEKFNGKCERRQVICLFFAPTTKACRVRFSQLIYMRTSSHEFAFEFAIFRFMIYFPISYVFLRVILSDSSLSFFFLSISTPDPNTALPVTSNRRANQAQECRYFLQALLGLVLRQSRPDR